ncbi:hypothetical protein BDZ97DRAFT_1764444 [Flammula alnicola]|nr:hypothetical protein BDZ97DRAFT_1764444 [Flammula alnicola]
MQHRTPMHLVRQRAEQTIPIPDRRGGVKTQEGELAVGWEGRRGRRGREEEGADGEGEDGRREKGEESGRERYTGIGREDVRGLWMILLMEEREVKDRANRRERGRGTTTTTTRRNRRKRTVREKSDDDGKTTAKARQKLCTENEELNRADRGQTRKQVWGARKKKWNERSKPHPPPARRRLGVSVIQRCLDRIPKRDEGDKGRGKEKGGTGRSNEAKNRNGSMDAHDGKWVGRKTGKILCSKQNDSLWGAGPLAPLWFLFAMLYVLRLGGASVPSCALGGAAITVVWCGS